MTKRIAVVFFNLGGPDSLGSVQPFLFNLFNDPAIISVPTPLRWALAQLISRTRRKSAEANYAMMGGASPLMSETTKQAQALARELNARVSGDATTFKVFIAMRYWHPFDAETAAEVRKFAPDEVVLLPLYPHFSTTTTESSLKSWAKVFDAPCRTLCCYPTQTSFIEAHAEAILETWRNAGNPEPIRVLFSAHGLPEKVIKEGDPYQWQIEQTCAAIVKRLPAHWQSRVCYQSRVGPLKWIGPSTPEAIAEAAKDQIGILITPVAFVSEHIETLVELDREYAEMAHDLKVPRYLRAPALGTRPTFINALADLVDQVLARETRAALPDGGVRICPQTCGKCPVPVASA